MATRQPQDVSLTPELDGFIDRCLATGAYRDASDVVRTALQLLYEQSDRQAELPLHSLDTTSRVKWERALAARDSELRRITNALPMLVSYIDADHLYRFANDAYADWFGFAPETMIGRKVPDIVGQAFYETRLPLFERALAGEAAVDLATLPHSDGRPRRCEIRYLPDIANDGSVSGFHVIAIDMEDRVLREEALAASNKRFHAAMNAVHGVLWTNSADGRMLGEQPGWAALTGQSFEDYQDYGWAQAVHPDDAQPTIDAWHRAVAAKSLFIFEHRVRHHSGAWRTFTVRAAPVFSESGAIVEWVGVHTDITEQRLAETALREHTEALARQVNHRERAEQQLRQLNETLETRVGEEIEVRRQAEAALARSQKLETIGKLTGGVAHDFNNLLQVISGNLQLLAKDVAGVERAERRIMNAMAGVSRGAKLASQLLAFGRRQPLEPKVVNVTRFVRGMEDMLRRTIGEAIEVETVLGGGLWNTFIDPTQIENALLNLAINARDAMAGAGKLTIELANVHLDDDYARLHDEATAGQFVMLAVTDTGCGMTAETAENAFEPFFSTKGEGKGSGLGLSMVYGFVRQSGGHVRIYSEVGHGTTVRLYLPRATDSEDVEVAVAAAPIAGGAETVLVVEDDDEVRETVVETLQDLGYRVLKAIDAASALIVIESGAQIDLLFTDVVMPGALKSPELAKKAKLRLPNIAVLFTSGYTENSIVHGGRLDAGVELLSKPYTREALARKIRQVLANQGPRKTTDDSVASKALPRAETTANAAANVLLVEDEPLIRMNMAEILQQAGCLVVEAGSAEEAMAALQTAPIDVLVTDVNLPGVSGPELAIRARELRPDIGLVFATGEPSAAPTVGDARAAVLAKPYPPEALISAVRSVFDGAMTQPGKEPA